jgi:4-hydroxythreonine-4-phosphate dehydrogenase
MNSERKPIIALAIGDPAGISPELTAKVLALKEVRDAARVVVVGDRRIYDEGARVAGAAASPDEFIDLKHPNPAGIQRGVATKAGGQSAQENYRQALRMVGEGRADAVCFTPFNKQAMRMAEPSYDDEILFTSNAIGFKGLATEFNVLEGL